MKHKIPLFIFLILLSTASFSQTKIEKIEMLMSEEKLKEALVIVDELLLTDSNSSKILLYKGMITQNRIQISMPSEVKRQILDSAYSYYRKSLGFDHQNFLSTVISEQLQAVSQQYAYTGMEEFNKGNYQSALFIFERSIQISIDPIVNNLDTMMLYNSAITAEKLKDFGKAEKYFKEILSYKPEDWNTVAALINVYKMQRKHEAYFSLIKKGSLEYPNVLMFQRELFVYYLENKEQDSALIYIDQLLEGESFDDKLYYLKGSILQEQGKLILAEKEYLHCLEINPTNVDAAFNLAANYYNKTIDLLLDKEKTKEDSLTIQKYLSSTLKYLEIVKIEEPENESVWSMLLVCYHELGMIKEKEELEKYIKSQKE